MILVQWSARKDKKNHNVVKMEDGRIAKDLLYVELTECSRPSGRPKLRYKDVCKRDLIALNINLNTWEAKTI